METAAARRKSRNRRIEAIAQRSISFLVIGTAILLWQLGAYLNATLQMVNPIFFPGPVKVGIEGWNMILSGELLKDLSASLSRVMAGFTIAAVIGIPLGTLAGRNRWVSRTLDPIVAVLRPIPPIALLPIMVVWLGIGDLSKVIFIAYAAFFQVFLTTYNGVQAVDPVLLRAASSLGARPLRTFWKVVMPAAMPQIVTGLRLGFSMSFFVIVAAEFIGASSGLGNLIFASRIYFEIDKMMVSAATIGILGFLFDFIMRAIERRLFAWRM